MLLQNGTHLEADSGLPVELLTEKLRSFSLFFPSPDHFFHSPFSFFFSPFSCGALYFASRYSFFPVIVLCFFSIFVFVLINEIGKVFNKHFYYFFHFQSERQMVCALKGIENVIEVIAKALDWRTTISDKCPYDPGFAPDFQNVCAGSDLPQYMVSSSERVAEREDLEGSVASYSGVGRIGRCCRKGNYYCCLG